MLKNYIKIAFRNLYRNKFYSGINIIGLSLAITVFTLIGLYITNELSYDKHFESSSQIYRIVQENAKTGKVILASVPPGLGSSINDLFPEIELLTELSFPGKRLFRINENSFLTENVISADSNFFQVFSFKSIAGNLETALSSPSKIVLTSSLSKRLFGDTDPIGKTINYENIRDVQVTAVVEDPPVNTHFNFEAILSLTPDQIKERNEGIKWQFFNAGFIYVKLKDQSLAKNLVTKIQEFESKASKPSWMGDDYKLGLQPLTSIHLSTGISNEIAPQGNPKYLYFFGSIAIILLAIACINYMNLSSVQALNRSKEVGVRKTFGAQKSQLMFQFLGESILLCLLTIPITLIAIEAILPFLNNWMDLSLSLEGDQYLPFLLALPNILLFTGIISGSYPAIFLSSMQPKNALNNAFKIRKTGWTLRSLVIFQFAVSVVLIVSTLTINSQLKYIQEKSLGFDKEQLITFSSGILKEQYAVFKDELSKEPSVVSVTSGPPAGLGHINYSFKIKDDKNNEHFVSTITADYDYAQTLGLDLKEGRWLSKEYPSDIENSVLITEEAAKVLGYNKSPGGFVTISGEQKKVVGILKDYHNAALFQEIQPVVIMLNPGNNWTGIIRLSKNNTQQGLEAVEKAWNAIAPNRPFEFSFLDQRIEAQYRKDEKLARLFMGFTFIAIFVACLGLFGLSAFIIKSRSKEISLRKILGASLTNISGLLSKEFIKLIFIGFLLAIPISWYIMNKWLSEFTYRINISYGTFLLSGVLIILIAIATICSQIIKAATTNPVESLKSE